MGKLARVRYWLWGSRWRKALTILATLVAFYAALGFLVLPAVAQWQLPKIVASRTTGTAHVKSVAFNPFTFDLRITGFGVSSAKGRPLLGFKKLDINFDLSSLVNQAYTFAWIRLQQPYVHANINASGSLNFKRLLKRGSGKSPAKSKSGHGSLPAIRVGRLDVDKGDITFTDDSHGRHFHAALHSVAFDLHHFSTSPKSTGPYRFAATAAGGQSLAWKGQIGVNPLSSHGDLRVKGLRLAHFWTYMRRRFNVALSHGRLGFDAHYSLAQGNKGLELSIQQGALNLTHLVLTRASSGQPVITVPRVHLGGIAFSQAQKQLKIATVDTRGGQIKARLEPDHRLDLIKLLQPVARGSKPASNKPGKPGGMPFQVSVGNVEVRHYGLDFTDVSGPKPVQFTVRPISLSISNYTSTGKQPLKVAAKVGLDGGQLSAQGKVSLHPLASTLHFTLSGLPVKPFQPYVSRYANLLIQSGQVGAGGTLDYKASQGRPDITFDGHASVDNFASEDTIKHQSFARLKHLSVQGIHYSSQPAGLTVKTVIADQPYARIIIEPNHHTNISAVLPGKKKKQAQAAAKRTHAARQAKSAGAGPSLPITIHRIKLNNGTADFADLSLTPHFSTGIQALGGTVTGLSTRPGTSADVDLHGKVNRYAPVSIKGRINPLAKMLSANIRMQFKGVGLTAFSPYSGKFAGYRIKKGKASLTLHYRISQGILHGSNKIVLNQLELGRRVKSPNAINLPLHLAIALLKNDQGVINLNLPVRGNLNNPKFAIGPLIGKAVVNVLEKAVTSPFRLLASLIPGGSAELSHIDFPPGLAALDAKQRHKLTQLAGALKKRPGLQLNVQGVAVPALDGHAMAEQTLMARISKKGASLAPGPALTKAQRRRLLALYRKTLNSDPQKLVTRGKQESEASYKARVVQAARKKLVQHIKLPSGALRGLAQARAEAVRSELVSQDHVEASRIYLIGSTIHGKSEHGQIQLSLKLQAR